MAVVEKEKYVIKSKINKMLSCKIQQVPSLSVVYQYNNYAQVYPLQF